MPLYIQVNRIPRTEKSKPQNQNRNIRKSESKQSSQWLSQLFGSWHPRQLHRPSPPLPLPGLLYRTSRPRAAVHWLFANYFLLNPQHGNEHGSVSLQGSPQEVVPSYFSFNTAGQTGGARLTFKEHQELPRAEQAAVPPQAQRLGEKQGGVH